MNNKNMTALVSCFSRSYHSKNYKYKIFDDYLADKLLTKEEYKSISFNMKKGINYFNKDFKGTEEEALRYIVDNHLSPSVLARSVYNEDMLKNSIKLGTKQYLIFASGYDTYAYRNKYNLNVFELDKEEMINDKIKRLDNAKIEHSKINYIKIDLSTNNCLNILNKYNYNKDIKTFCSLLGISYYLTVAELDNLFKNISEVLKTGGSIIMDYPTIDETNKEIINKELAKEANEEMKSKYSLKDLELMLQKYNLYIYENLNDIDINNKYFDNYNILNPNNKIHAPKGINYCLIVKQ